MFTITTATGRTFESDYAVTLPSHKVAFIRIVGHTYSEVSEIFRNNSELPLVGYEDYRNVAGIIDEGNGIKLVLTP